MATISVNPAPGQTGGGTYTLSPDPGAINSSTGDIDSALLDAGSGSGTTYTVTYTVSAACGPKVHQETFLYCNPPDPSFTIDTDMCDDETSVVPSSITTPGGIFSIDSGTINPATGEVDPSSLGIGTYNITYVVKGPAPCDGCQDQSTVEVTVSAGATAAFTIGDQCIV